MGNCLLVVVVVVDTSQKKRIGERLGGRDG